MSMLHNQRNQGMKKPTRTSRFFSSRRTIPGYSILSNIISRKPLVIAIGVIILAIIVTQSHHSTATTPQTKSTNNPSAPVGDLTKETPRFPTLLPSGKTIESFGGWTRVSPQNREPAYAFSDTVAGTPIIVSQQMLPKEFSADTEQQINLLAQGYHANHTIKANGTTVYIGTSDKGPQSVILTKSSLLILIKSSAKLPDDTWIKYINSLN